MPHPAALPIQTKRGSSKATAWIPLGVPRLFLALCPSTVSRKLLRQASSAARAPASTF